MNKDNDNIIQQDTELKILKAAEKEFLSKGFAGARTTSIAEAAGVTHAMLHYYFRTKGKLFERVLAEKTALLKAALINSLSGESTSLEDMIRNIIEGHLDFLAANPELPHFLIEEIYNDPERAKIFATHMERFAPVMLGNLQMKIDNAAEEGKCRKVDARMLMLDIVSLNVFSYIAAPIVRAVLGELTADPEAFLKARKKENFDTIMRKLMIFKSQEARGKGQVE